LSPRDRHGKSRCVTQLSSPVSRRYRMSKKILMLVGDFVEDYEVMVPFQSALGTRVEHDALASV